MESRDPLDVGLKYLQTYFIPDVIATLPSMLSNHKIELQILRTLHVFSYVRIAMVPINLILLSIFPVSPHKRSTLILFTSYYIFLVTTVHYTACASLYIGDKYLLWDTKNDPWMIAHEEFGVYTDYQLYVFSVYEVLVTITTVGYGDYTAGTSAEFILTVIVELIGLAVFSFLMHLVSLLVDTDY